jgi:hypothetical protein
MSLGTINSGDISEASGLIASRQNPGVLWTHNDDGTPGTIMAVQTNGSLLAHFSVPGVFYGDFEDIAIGPGPDPAFHYIYLGDIGDNFASRGSIHVYRFPEPAAYEFQSASVPWFSVGGAQDIELLYPDGAHNAEGMLVDPRTGDLFIFIKLTSSGKIYRATRAEMDSGQPVTLTFMRDISFQKVSGADISDDGSLIALRRGGTANLWVRSSGQSVDEAFNNGAAAIPLATEPNGEAITFAPNAGGYYTLSEGYYQPIYWFARTDTTPSQPRVFLPPGASWLYNDYGDPAGEDWFTTNYDEGFYNTGVAPFGSNSGERTTTYTGLTTTYFRAHFNVVSTNGLTNLALRVCFNDGIAGYLNGTEVVRKNLPPGADNGTSATTSREGLRQQWTSFAIDPALLHLGDNVLAFEVHSAPGSTSLNFDAQLVEALVDAPPHFTAPPQRVGGQWRLRLAGPNGRSLTVQKSSDFSEWTNVGTVLLTGGEATLNDPSNGTAVFYRIAP